MSCCYHNNCGCFDGCSCGCGRRSYCPFPEWMHPIMHHPVRFCDAENDNGPTLVIHQILLEPCGNQSCTPRTFTIRVTGPSYPCGETFSLRAGSCTEIDEPLVITGLIPGEYQIEQVTSTCSCGCSEYDTTYTGPISCNSVSVTASRVPVVITIVSRKRFCRRRRCNRCGWQSCNGNCGRQGCGCSNNCSC